jgi:hypothetical protein
MADVVGLRFVTTGEREAIAAYDRYKAGLLSLGQVQDKHVAAFNRRAREELRAINDVARAAAQAARVRQQAAQSYSQLAGSMDPAVAAANRLASAQKVLQTAFDQGVISAQKKAAMLRQLNAQYKADELNRYAAAQRRVSDAIIQGDAVVKRLSGDMQTLTERLKQGTITQQQHDTALKALARQLAINNNYVKANGDLNTRKAMAELRAMEATRAAAAADAAAVATKARLTQSYNQLLASINPVIARQQQTRQTVDMLRAAVAAGSITTTQAAQALLQYRNALRQLDAANQLATRGMNRVGVVTQQAGYQVGDFIVQIQSGTNAFVALGQQATQLIGTFAMLARTTRGIAIFSGLGVIVPILTAIGAAWSRMSAAADESANAVKGLRNEIESLDRAVQDWINTKKASEAGITVEELLGTRGIEQARADLAAATETLAEFQATMNSAAAVGPAAGIDFVKGLFDADAASAYESAVGKVVDAHTLLANLLQKQGEEQFANFAEQKRELDQQLALQQEIAQFGRDSVQVRQLELEQEISNRQRAIQQQVEANDLTVAQGIALQKVVEDFLRAEAAAEGVKSAVASTDLSSLAAQASLLAANMGVAADEAARYNAALNRQAGIPDNTGQPRLGFGGLGSVEDGAGLGVGFARLGFGNLDEPRLRTRTPMATPAGRGGGGGGGAAREQEDYLQNLLDEAEQKRRLVGLTEEETRRQEILFELKKRELPLSDERIEQIIQTEAETRKLIEAEQRREQMMQTIEGHIQSAFMSMVDGSQSVEDAFRNMLRNILLAVYEQQIAEPAATGIGNLLSKGLSSLFGPGMTTGTPLQIPSSGVQSLLPSANGTAWNNGVQFFANGGVVGSPTMFGHSGGLGVMGEAGPEAIMPLKRGSDGKLGVVANGGSLKVNVVMDPSTGALGAFVQDQAGQVVAKAAPQLAQYASKTMVDQRRRGGTMKAAFRG